MAGLGAESQPKNVVGVEELVGLLVALGHDELTVRDQLAVVENADGLALEIAALAVESEAGTVLPVMGDLDAALFELVDMLRQAGAAISFRRGGDGTAFVVCGDALMHVYAARFSEGADIHSLLRALTRLLPETQQILIAAGYDAGEAVPVVVIDRAVYQRFAALVGAPLLERVLVRDAGSTSSVSFIESVASALSPLDLAARASLFRPEATSNPELAALFARVRSYDPRVAWPEAQRRPPGDDFFELAATLASGPLQRCLDMMDPCLLANLLYRFALVTTVGARWDVLAARQNPGMSAQGVLGFGQLTWSWFIFDALAARDEAAACGELLDHAWVRAQERGTVSLRQRAWFDLGAFLRRGTRGPSLGRLRELLPLCEHDAWRNREDVENAVALHTEPHGDQLTHQPIYYAWPAPLYALARRAGALSGLPADNPFLAYPLHMEDVDKTDELVVRLHEQLRGFAALDESRLPPLLDPLPVIVDVRITEVDAKVAHGRTMLAGREEAEHHVVAPHDGRAMRAGEIWLFEVRGARPSRAKARYHDLGEVTYNIALPTGVWLSRA